MEAKLVRYLAQRAGREVSQAELLEEVWGYPSSSRTRTVYSTVAKVRTKIEVEPSKPRHLRKVHGVGYRLVVPSELPSQGVFVCLVAHDLDELWREAPTQAAATLEAEWRAARSALAGGHEIVATGDSMSVAFEHGQAAVEFATTRCVASSLALSAGLDAGSLSPSAALAPAHLFASRVARIAYPGQVLSSDRLAGAGAHAVAGPANVLGRRESLLEWGRSRFPPLVAREVRRTIPAAPAYTVGAATELAELEEGWLTDNGLLWLTGPWGAGKTHIALRFAHQLAHEGVPVWFCDCAHVRSRTMLVSAMAKAIGVELPSVGGESAFERFLVGLGRGLVVLDSAEQVMSEVAELARLTEATLLGTTRIAPPIGDAVRVQPLEAGDARELLLSRLSPRPAEAVLAQLLDWLRGSPLAIELLAARSALLTPEEMVSRLDQRWALLGGRTTRRGDSLWASVAWSISLLPEEDQRALTTLALFRGPIPSTAPDELRALARRLTTMHLASEDSGVVRLVRDVRSYVREGQSVSDEAVSVWHGALRALASAEQDLTRAEVVAPSRSDLEAFFDESLDREDAAASIDAAMALSVVWMDEGLVDDALGALSRLEVVAAGSELTALRLRVAEILLKGGSFERIEALCAAIDADDPLARPVDRANLRALILTYSGQPEHARLVLDDVRPLVDLRARTVTTSSYWRVWGNCMQAMGVREQAMQCFRRAVETAPDPLFRALALVGIGNMEARRGSWTPGNDDLRALKSCVDELPDGIVLVPWLFLQSCAHSNAGELDAARHGAEACRRHARRAGLSRYEAAATMRLALLLAACGELGRARAVLSSAIARQVGVPSMQKTLQILRSLLEPPHSLFLVQRRYLGYDNENDGLLERLVLAQRGELDGSDEDDLLTRFVVEGRLSFLRG